jgi:[ribosomal protein S18]-alanine N-acetyltransferase
MVQLDPQMASILAEIHRESIDPPWSEESFRSTLRMPTGVGFAHPDFSSFALFSVVGEEAETLTFATQVLFRRQGRGHSLLRDCFDYLSAKNVKKFFLEVDENNFAAIALYKKLDFKQYGIRENYYTNQAGKISHAVLMSRDTEK